MLSVTIREIQNGFLVWVGMHLDREADRHEMYFETWDDVVNHLETAPHQAGVND